jgi:heme oxygenase
MMGGMARKSLKLAEDKGTAFYSFTEIPNTRDFIDEWYTTLNKLEYTEEQMAAIVDEANVAFRLNIEIFDELEGSAVKSAFGLVLSAIKDKLGSLFK